MLGPQAFAPIPVNMSIMAEKAVPTPGFNACTIPSRVVRDMNSTVPVQVARLNRFGYRAENSLDQDCSVDWRVLNVQHRPD